MPKVSYTLLEGPHEGPKEGEKEEEPLPTDRMELMKLVAQQDNEVEELKMKAKQLRSKHHGDHDDWATRIENLEAHLLSAKLQPVADAKDMLPEDPPLPPDLVPNGLLQEFADRATCPELFPETEEEKEEENQRRLELKSQALGLPTIADLALPEGSKIVDIRLIDPGHVDERFRAERRAEAKKPPQIEPPSLQGRIIDSNYALLPSPYHPVGQFAQMGLLNNMYPIDRAPMSYENLFQSTWPGAQEQWYTAYADYFAARRFPPQMFPEGRWEMDVDKGKPVYGVQWRSTPGGDNMAAVGIDLNRDGFSDMTFVGKDLNHDGVPDMLQVHPAVRMAQDACSKVFPY